MYLSKWSSITEAAEWLSANRGEHYSWRRVVEEFADTQPHTIAIVIPIDTPLVTHGVTEPEEVSFRFPVLAKVSHVWEFLAHIAMGDDFHTAAAYPRLILAGKSRYTSAVSVKAKWLRLSATEVRKLGLSPFDQLMKQVRTGQHPQLAAMLGIFKPKARVAFAHQDAPQSQNTTKSEYPLGNPVLAVAQRIESPSIRLRRSIPASGDALTILIWDVCFKLTEETGSQRPAAIMAVLVELASTPPRPHPLVGLGAGIVVYEDGKGREKELTDSRLRGRIRGWMKQNRVKFSRAGKFISQA